ncbi:MAG: hypothetical protein WC512_04025 [Candidatus Omnitrophota bacterium]
MRSISVKKRIFFVAALLAICLAAHFLPFERAALAPDDYASLVRSLGPGSGSAAYDERPPEQAFSYGAVGCGRG